MAPPACRPVDVMSEGPAPETRWLTAGGKRLEWRHWGPQPDQAPTILLLHEGLGSISLWRDFPERLAEATGWGVTAYSRAGYGRSERADLPRPLDYLKCEAVEVLPDVLEATGFRRGILLGHSDGGSIAALYGAYMPDPRVEGLVLMAPHMFIEPVCSAELHAVRRLYPEPLRAKLARHHADPDNAFYGWNDAWTDPRFTLWNEEAAIPQIRQPILAIQGREDQYATLRQIEVFAESAPGPVELLPLEACRHIPHHEQPEAVLAAVARFCAGLEAGFGG